MFTFLGTTVPFYIPTSTAHRLHFLLTNAVYFLFFWWVWKWHLLGLQLIKDINDYPSPDDMSASQGQEPWSLLFSTRS